MKPKQLFEFLKKSILNKLPILIKGAPGIGKTDIVKQASEEINADLIISHPVVSDPTDYKGMPTVVKEGDVIKAKFLPFNDLESLISANKLTCFFMDDLGQASPSVQASAMQLILGRRINGHKVSDQVCFIAATNRKTDKAGVSGILEPVKSRFASIVELNPDMDDWVKWALTNKVPTELIAFVRFRPNLLFNFKPSSDLTNSPCPRTVENVAKLMPLVRDTEVEFEAYSGAAGEGFAVEFLAFLKIFRTLPNPDMVIMNPDTAPLPSDPATLYALCGALAKKASDNTAERLVKYANRLPAEFSVLLIRDAIQICSQFVNTRAYIEWASNHQEVLI
ncbi:MAG: ATP-binding protein [Desulfobacterales bacterium]|nr:ATP-binding protein [Desulfobacterales bacterium]